MSLTVLVLAIVGISLWVPLSSFLDMFFYLNPEFRRHVVFKERPMNTEREVFNAYMETNLYEAGLVIAGLVAGYVLGVF